MISVYYLMKSGITPEFCASLLGMIPTEERDGILMRPDTDSRTDTLFGRGLLRAALAKEFCIAPADTVILKEPHGKPYLRDHGNVHFSISHTATCVACAVGDIPVGLDVETVSEREHGRVSAGFFTENERAYIGDDPRRFYDIWTRKECFAKLTGEGIIRALAEVDVLTGENTGDAVFVPIVIPDTAACVCTEREDTVRVCELTEIN